METKFYEKLLDALPDAICVVDAVTNRIKYINQVFSSDLLPAQYLIGQEFQSEILQSHDLHKYSSARICALESSSEIELGTCLSLTAESMGQSILNL
jgi:hypothetical protein